MASLIRIQQGSGPTSPLSERIRSEIEKATDEAVRDVQAEQRTERIVVPPVPPVTRPGEVVVVQRPPWADADIPPRLQEVALGFFFSVAFVIVGWPIARAIGRRIERGTPQAPPLPREVSAQLQHLTQAVDAIAIEVERIAEGQRFTTRMLAHRAGESQPANQGSN